MSIRNSKLNRRALLATGLVLPIVHSANAKVAGPKQTVLYEHTFLKAVPDRRASLSTYIKTNWFQMDKKGLEQGIFTSYELLAEIDENKDWDFVMVVGYPQLQGYEEPATMMAFKAIRTAHKEVLIEGQGLKELGSIVRHHRLKVVQN